MLKTNGHPQCQIQNWLGKFQWFWSRMSQTASSIVWFVFCSYLKRRSGGSFQTVKEYLCHYDSELLFDQCKRTTYIITRQDSVPGLSCAFIPSGVNDNTFCFILTGPDEPFTLWRLSVLPLLGPRCRVGPLPRPTGWVQSGFQSLPKCPQPRFPLLSDYVFIYSPSMGEQIQMSKPRGV